MECYESVAIFGANSQIALDYLSFKANSSECDWYLFSRGGNVENLRMKFRKKKSLPYSEFYNHNYDLIINFIGSSDPIKLKILDKKYLEISEEYDNIIINYLLHNKNCQYIFISSGASYGDIFNYEPASIGSISSFLNDAGGSTDYYGLSKHLIEKKHLRYSDLRIVDLRIFSYIGFNQELNSSMLIPSMVKAILNKNIFETSSSNIFRDYSCIEDVSEMIDKSFTAGSGVFDFFTKQKVSKFEILSLYQNQIKIKIYDNSLYDQKKKFYYSENFEAEKIGFKPKYKSIDNIKRCIDFMIMR